MITIRIGQETRSDADASESWINEQINRRRADRQNVCVEVCGGVGGRPPNGKEREVLDLWNRRGLNANDFTGGSLVAFLKQLRSLLG